MEHRSHYARVLEVLAAFLSSWEPAIAAALGPQWEGWLSARARRRFLERDLAHLGLEPRPPDTFPLPAGAAAAWGSVYVMEGSALGGQVISRRLARAGLQAESGGAYFHGWGDATAPLWRETTSVLRAQLRTPAELARACQGARCTFHTLSVLLEQLHDERAALA
jgi:heme oxygenase